MSACSRGGDRGYAMAALLVGMSVMAIMMSMALPVWRTAVQREREAELIFRGEQYAHAIELFSRRNGGFPTSLDALEKGKFIRKLYKDPMTGEGDFQPVYVGQVVGGQPVVPGQQGRGAAGQGRGTTPATPAGRGAQPAAAAGRGAPSLLQAPGAGIGQPAGTLGRGTPIGGGPIIGVISKSTADSLRLYNGRGKYNEWAFVATVTTQQAGAPTSAQTPNMPGRGGPPGQGIPGRGGPGRLGPGRGGPVPGRGFPGRGAPEPGRASPFDNRGGFPQPGGQPRGRAPLP